mgnify:CR=1 FL=1
MKPSAINFEQSKEWYHRMAAIEEASDCAISAGLPIFYPPWITGFQPVEKPKRTRKSKIHATTAKPKPARKRRATAVKPSSSQIS